MGDRINAATITVTGTGDTIAVDGFVTLREAITASNTDAISGDAPAGSGTDTIEFNIAGLPGTVHTIQPTSALPVITDPVIIDGYSQLGATLNTLASGSNAFLAIELDGTNAGATPGLSISAGNSTVQGLVINRFANEGILITAAGANTIRGNFIGTDQTGLLDRGNLSNGLSVHSSNNVVGGSTSSDRNVISGNDGHGIAILDPGITANRILGNDIGTTKNGVTALSNSGSGVYISEGNNNVIGGLLPENGNVIAFNGDNGILIDAAAGIGNLVLGNSIHDNSLLGIDLSDDGVTLNDALDADVGPNNLQNYAVLLSATTNEFGTVVQGSLASTPNTAHRIEFFANTAADASGYGEGQTYIGFIDVTTDASGNATFVFQSSTSQTVGTLISSTTTDPNNSTSEFSANVAVVYRASEENDDDGDDDNIFSDDDGFGPFPLPFGGPVPPLPPAAAPPITPVLDGTVAPDVTPVVEAKKEVSAVSASEVSSMENAPALRNEEINIRPKPRKNPNTEESSGCSTLSGVDTSLFALCALVMAWVRFRLRRKA